MVRQEATVEADKSVGFKWDMRVVRVIGRFGFAFLYPNAVARIEDVA